MNKKKTAVIFMASGLILIISALSLLIYNNIQSNKAKESSAGLMTSLQAAISENIINSLPEDPFDSEMKIKDIDGYGYIGYLYIPSLELELPVMSQWDYDRLKISPCRYYGSTKTDNLVIAAHNYKYHFGYIGHLNAGEVITFTDMDGKVFSYKVTSVELLSPTDTDKVKDTGDDLILYTCTYGGASRITVRCSYTASAH